MKLRGALEGVSAKHRSIVASTIGLGKRATAEEIAACLFDDARLAQIVAGLSPDARRAGARKALGARVSHVYTYYGRVGDPARIELERHGLAFAYRGSWAVEYAVPEDLRGKLAHALAGAHVAGVKAAGRADRWLGAPLALAHDAAALWAALHREPARVKTDGELYQRAWPKLLGALPPLDLFGPDDELGLRRADAALAVLREEGCLRVRLDDALGWETKRELVAAGELAHALGLDADELRRRLLDHLEGKTVDTAGMTVLAAVAARGEVSLASFGAALRGLLEEAGERDPRSANVNIALLGVQLAWLVGLAEIGVDRSGKPVAVRGCAPGKAGSLAGSRATADLGAAPGPRAVCQGNFEVVLLAEPTPLERLVMELACEPVVGQRHVYRITRRSVAVGERAGVSREGVLGALRELAGELPQNVARSIADWAAGCGPPLRVRTAMMLEAVDAPTADALADGPLAGLVVERIGESLLAFAADRLDEVQAALATAGRELEPGLDRISGRWEDRDRGQSAVEREWLPNGAPASASDGRLVSTVGQWKGAQPTPAEPRVSAPPQPARASSAREPANGRSSGPASPQREREDTAVAEPLDVILEAIEDESEVMIVYAGARGVTHRCITPFEVEGSAVHAYCHLRDDERHFWVGSIMAATAVRD